MSFFSELSNTAFGTETGSDCHRISDVRFLGLNILTYC